MPGASARSMTGPAAATPSAGSLAGDIFAVAGRTPDAPAMTGGGSADAPLTYARLTELARRAGARLDARCPDRRRPLALVATKSAASFAVVLSCLASGRPLLLISPDLGESTRAALVGRCGAQAVVTVADGEPVCHDAPAGGAAPAPLPPGTALVLTTSGSTGVPKLVPLTGAALDAFTAWAGDAFALDGASRVLNYAPLNFDLCLLDVWATLRHGGCVVPVDPARAVDPAHLAGVVRRTRPHLVQAVPLFFRLLAEAAGEESFPGVRDVVVTGDHAPRPVRARLPHLFPHARLHNVYGCTETNDSMLHTFTADESAGPDALPLGRPLPGAAVAVLAGDREVTGPGTGELIVSTPFQTPGYLADAPGDRFLQRAGRTWYRTGDLVERGPDGRLTLVGRTDFQVKVRGVRVSLEEVERVLAGHHQVAEAAVIAVPDQEAGACLHAFVRPTTDELTGLRLRADCAGRLTRVAIPGRFHLVADPLPVGPTGKVDRLRLQEYLA
ncbi:AMP-binding protein [Streptomyces sp. HMX112]|uniref:AMP-binding protein n=1 Tax=Streptomyces sp. HMX112 TaxID=3390850 RepID=UPI003A7F8DC6